MLKCYLKVIFFSDCFKHTDHYTGRQGNSLPKVVGSRREVWFRFCLLLNGLFHILMFSGYRRVKPDFSLSTEAKIRLNVRNLKWDSFLRTKLPIPKKVRFPTCLFVRTYFPISTFFFLPFRIHGNRWAKPDFKLPKAAVTTVRRTGTREMLCQIKC